MATMVAIVNKTSLLRISMSSLLPFSVFRRMRAKHGAAKAIVTTACKIARIVYPMLKDKREYVDHGADYYEHRYQEQGLQRLKRQAAKLGMKLVSAPA